MTEHGTQAKSSNKWLRIVLPAIVLAVIAVAVYPMLPGGGNNETANSPAGEAAKDEIVAAPGGISKKLSTGKMTAFVIHKARKDMPQVAFRDKDKKELKLSDWKGRVVLLNLWATWCAPCRREMPHLDRLQGELGGKDFEVVAISVDRKGVKASKKFLDEVGANNLALYVDRSTAVLRTIRAVGLPTTVLIDRNGKEIGRMVGPADWYSPDAIRLIKTAIAEK